MDKMVYGQNGIGQNGMEKWYGQNGTHKISQIVINQSRSR